MSGGRRPHEPTKPATRGRDDPPPAPPHELDRERGGERRFTHEGRHWIARVGGKAAYGTGSYGLALVEAVHFCDAADPDRPLREALLAHGEFDALFDSELIRLLGSARPIETRNP
ncbi:MAG TPA: hypothetical protein VFZ69_01580 [Longimicrobiales bacterium]